MINASNSHLSESKISEKIPNENEDNHRNNGWTYKPLLIKQDFSGFS